MEWVARSFSRGSSWPRGCTGSPTLQEDPLPSEPPGKPLEVGCIAYKWRACVIQWRVYCTELSQGSLVLGNFLEMFCIQRQNISEELLWNHGWSTEALVWFEIMQKKAFLSWRRLLRVPWTARRSNPINPKGNEYSLAGLMLKLKLQYFGHLMQRADSLEKTLMLGKIEGRRRRGQERLR